LVRTSGSQVEKIANILLDSTVGIFKFAFVPQEHNATILDSLIDAGCIPFCKTNVPQTMLSFECSNPLWGRTSNPHNERLVPGGSSGGEGALIGAKGSVLGIGRYYIEKINHSA
jgi:amidase